MLGRILVIVIFLVICSTPSLAQTQTSDPSVKIGSKEVLLDVIARDKKGRNVRDLKPEEIEIYEDGIKQTIASIKLIEADPQTEIANANKTAQPSLPVDPARPINLVTMVFDNLDNSSRKLSREAALDFVNTGMRKNVLVAIYTVGNRFFVLQPFTSDKEKVRQAIELATNRAETQYGSVSKNIVTQMEIVANSSDFGPGAGAPAQAQASAVSNTNFNIPTMPGGITPTGAGRGGTGLDKAIAQITLNTLLAVQTAMAEQQARASIYTFLHVAREQRLLGGRKTLLYFSTGMVVPPNLVDVLRTAMSEANRANVSIYAIDARGLQIDNESESARAQMALAIKASNDAFNDSGSMSALAGSFKSSETAESSIRQNKQGTLAELAEGTGGALIANTNDLRKPIRQVADDISSYYAISYSPLAQELDGKFRKISLKLLRSDLKVTSRSGYFAIPTIDGKAVMGYEMPMLAALNEPAPKKDFPYQLGILRFTPGAQSQHTLLMAVPLSEISFQTDKAKKQYSTHFSVLALVKNEKGEVVTRVSQDYPLQGKLERLESLKKGNFDFTKSFSLAPGKYILQTVVRDIESNTISTQSRTLIVPEVNPNLALSSLALIRRLDPVGLNKPNIDKPLLTSNGRVVPEFENNISAEAAKGVGFFVTAYTTSKEKAQLLLTFSQAEKTIAQTAMDLPAPDELGRIQHVFSIPIDSFSSGEYQVKAIVNQAMASAESVTNFKLDNPNPSKAIVAATAQVAPKDVAPETEITTSVKNIAPPISTVGISEAVLKTTATMSNKSVGGAAVNINELLTEANKNGAILLQKLMGFTYQLRKVQHTLNDEGNPTKEEFQDYEAYPVRGRHVLIKIADNGKKLADWEVEQERKTAGGELERAETDKITELKSYVTAAVTGSYRGKYAGLLIDPTAFLEACDFTDPRTEIFLGREMIALDFTPRLGAKLPVVKAFAANLIGTIWIDANDKIIARIEAKNIISGLDKAGKPLRISPEPKLVYQQIKLLTGEWFPSVIRFNADGDGSAFYGLNWDVVFEFSNYQ